MERVYVAKKDVRTIFGGLICIKGTKVKIIRECSLGTTGKGITLDGEKQEFYFSTKKGFEKNFEEIKGIGVKVSKLGVCKQLKIW